MTKKHIDFLNYSDNSISMGLNSIEDIISHAKHNNHQSAVLVDENTLRGSYEFSKKCENEGIKPILGTTISISKNNEIIGKVALLAKNKNGYNSICQILSNLTYREDIDERERENFQTCVDFKVVKELLDDVIVIDGFKHSLFDKNNSKNYFKIKDEIFGGHNDFFISVNPEINTSKYEKDEYKKLNFIVGRENRYRDSINFQKEIFLGRFEKLKEFKQLKSIKEIFNFFNEKEELNKSQEYYDKVENLKSKFNFKNENLEQSIEGYSIDKNGIEKLFNASLRSILETKWKKFRKKIPKDKWPEYGKRIKSELDIISNTENGKQDFSDYFVTKFYIAEIAKRNGHPVSLRGSAASSLILYILGISKVDSLKFDLMFERFMNPERMKEPDIDLDIGYRKEFIELLKNELNKNGRKIGLSIPLVRENVKNPLTVFDNITSFIKRFSKPPAKSKVGLENAKNEFKYLPGKSKKKASPISEFIKENDKWIEKYNSNKDLKKMLDLCIQMETKLNNIKKHPSAVYISNKDFNMVSAIKKNGDSEVGLLEVDYNDNLFIKLDLLSSNTLERLNKMSKNIYLEDGDEQRDILEEVFEYDDKSIFEMISAGHTKGLEQVGQPIGTKLCKELGVNSFSDLVIINALIRDYEKTGEESALNEVKKLKNNGFNHRINKYEDILKRTYGMIIYEEQILKIGTELAGLSLGDADVIRSAIKDKNTDIIEKYRKQFLTGLQKSGFEYDESLVLFEEIKNKNYTFNEAHSCAYADIIYKQAYLMKYHPDVYLDNYMDQVLNDSVDPWKVRKVVAENNFEFDEHSIKYMHFRRKEIEEFMGSLAYNDVHIMRPCINRSGLTSKSLFEVRNNKKYKVLYPSLLPVNLVNDGSSSEKNFSNIDSKMLNMIIEERSFYTDEDDEETPYYKDLLDFVERVLPIYVGDNLMSIRKTDEIKVQKFKQDFITLIDIGAFDDFAPKDTQLDITVLRTMFEKNIDNLIHIAKNPELDDSNFDLEMKIYEPEKTIQYYIEKERAYMGYSPVELRMNKQKNVSKPKMR